MAISASALHLVITEEPAIARIIIDGEVIEFSSYVNSLEDINSTLSMSVSGANINNVISAVYSFVWQASNANITAADTQTIGITSLATGSTGLSVYVNDGVTDSENATATVSVAPFQGNTAPIVEITPDGITVEAGELVTLTANITDTVGDTHTYLWFNGAVTPSITLTAPTSSSASQINVTCQVFDSNNLESNIATALINVNASGDVDTTKPVITVSGDPVTTIKKGDDLPVFTYGTDDGSSVEVDDGGLINEIGTYVLRYNSVDLANNEADEVTRVVIVESADVVVTPITTTVVKYSVDTLWQNSDNIFPVEAEFVGVPFSPNLASKAEYSIYDRGNRVLIGLTLGSGITVSGDQFIVDISRNLMTFYGDYTHQFVIYDLEDNKLAPIFQRKLRIVRVPV